MRWTGIWAPHLTKIIDDPGRQDRRVAYSHSVVIAERLANLRRSGIR
jgi:hypothetical protein